MNAMLEPMKPSMKPTMVSSNSGSFSDADVSATRLNTVTMVAFMLAIAVILLTPAKLPKLVRNSVRPPSTAAA